jgi:hypothetical protein
MLIQKKKLFSTHVSIRKPPFNIKQKDDLLFSHEYQSTICSTFYLLLKNVDVLEDTVFDISTNTFFAAYTHVNGSFSCVEKIHKLKLFLKKSIKIEKGVWITQNWTWMYFHWMTDALTRLIALEGVEGKFPVILPVSYKTHPYIVESLELLGYDYVWYTPTQRLRILELLLPSHTASPGNYNAYYLNKLRNRFEIKKNVPFRKVFISRSQAFQRYIINEDEVIDVLLSFGFEVHIFENYPLLKQIELMSETLSLLGLHGAGLTNMLFMPEHGSIIELRNKGDRHNNCYFSMASELNHSYYYLQGEGDSNLTANVNIKIDTIELKNLLNLLFPNKINN